MLERTIEVRETNIGHGVFALRPFPAKTHVGVISGQLIDGEDYSSDYAIEFSDDLSLDPDPPFRFLNHSCNPNCELVMWKDDDGIDDEMNVFTLREIYPGEEMTIDYSWPSDYAIRCLCREPNCRGWVVAEDEVEKLADGTTSEEVLSPATDDAGLDEADSRSEIDPHAA